jgi:hypothetical protein
MVRYNLNISKFPKEGLVMKMKRSASTLAFKKQTDVVEEHLKTFDELDIDVFRPKVGQIVGGTNHENQNYHT